MASGLKITNFSVRGIKGFDLEIRPGQSIGLTGPSGAGKTLLLRALADLDPHKGSMWLDGVAAEDMPVHQWRRQVGLLPAESAWWHDNVGPHFIEIDDQWLASLGFSPDVRKWRVGRLSSGERQRLGLLRLLMIKPKVLLLDEPTANLDRDNIRRVEELLGRYRSDHHAAVIWVSHDREQLDRNCRRRFVIRKGRLVREDGASIQGQASK